MSNRYRLTGLLIALLLLVMTSSAFAKGVPPFAAVRDNALVLSGFGDELIEIKDPFTRGFFSTAWSPDGSKLAYVTYDLEYNYHLMVTDSTGQNPFEVPTERLENGFPLTFAPDGTLIYVEQGVPGQFPTDAYEATLKAVQPEAGATPETLGSFVFGTGCGGGSSFPGDWRYSAEAGFGGYGLTLAVIPATGVVHSTNCGGSGLAIFDSETGEDRLLAEGIGRADLSPDRLTIAAIRTVYHEPEVIRSLVLVDVASGTVTDIETESPPDQLTWSPDGTLFYSSREVTGNLAADLSPNEQESLNNAIGYVPEELPSYTVSIHHYNLLNGGSEKLVYEDDAYAIGRLDSPMRDVLVFSQIANQGDWLEGIVNGTIEALFSPTGEKEQLDAVPVTLYLLPPETSTAIEIAQNLSQFDLQSHAL